MNKGWGLEWIGRPLQNPDLLNRASAEISVLSLSRQHAVTSATFPATSPLNTHGGMSSSVYNDAIQPLGVSNKTNKHKAVGADHADSRDAQKRVWNAALGAQLLVLKRRCPFLLADMPKDTKKALMQESVKDPGVRAAYDSLISALRSSPGLEERMDDDHLEKLVGEAGRWRDLIDELVCVFEVKATDYVKQQQQQQQQYASSASVSADSDSDSDSGPPSLQDSSDDVSGDEGPPSLRSSQSESDSESARSSQKFDDSSSDSDDPPPLASDSDVESDAELTQNGSDSDSDPLEYAPKKARQSRRTTSPLRKGRRKKSSDNDNDDDDDDLIMPPEPFSIGTRVTVGLTFESKQGIVDASRKSEGGKTDGDDRSSLLSIWMRTDPSDDRATSSKLRLIERPTNSVMLHQEISPEVVRKRVDIRRLFAPYTTVTLRGFTGDLAAANGRVGFIPHGRLVKDDKVTVLWSVRRKLQVRLLPVENLVRFFSSGDPVQAAPWSERVQFLIRGDDKEHEEDTYFITQRNQTRVAQAAAEVVGTVYRSIFEHLYTISDTVPTPEALASATYKLERGPTLPLDDLVRAPLDPCLSVNSSKLPPHLAGAISANDFGRWSKEIRLNFTEKAPTHGRWHAQVGDAVLSKKTQILMVVMAELSNGYLALEGKEPLPLPMPTTQDREASCRASKLLNERIMDASFRKTMHKSRESGDDSDVSNDGTRITLVIDWEDAYGHSFDSFPYKACIDVDSEKPVSDYLIYYCVECLGVTRSSVKFCINGDEIDETKTPCELDLKAHDCINACPRDVVFEPRAALKHKSNLYLVDNEAQEVITVPRGIFKRDEGTIEHEPQLPVNASCDPKRIRSDPSSRMEDTLTRAAQIRKRLSDSIIEKWVASENFERYEVPEVNGEKPAHGSTHKDVTIKKSIDRIESWDTTWMDCLTFLEFLLFRDDDVWRKIAPKVAGDFLQAQSDGQDREIEPEKLGMPDFEVSDLQIALAPEVQLDLLTLSQLKERRRHVKTFDDFCVWMDFCGASSNLQLSKRQAQLAEKLIVNILSAPNFAVSHIVEAEIAGKRYENFRLLLLGLLEQGSLKINDIPTSAKDLVGASSCVSGYPLLHMCARLSKLDIVRLILDETDANPSSLNAENKMADDCTEDDGEQGSRIKEMIKAKRDKIRKKKNAEKRKIQRMKKLEKAAENDAAREKHVDVEDNDDGEPAECIAREEDTEEQKIARIVAEASRELEDVLRMQASLEPAIEASKVSDEHSQQKEAGKGKEVSRSPVTAGTDVTALDKDVDSEEKVPDGANRITGEPPTSTPTARQWKKEIDDLRSWVKDAAWEMELTREARLQWERLESPIDRASVAKQLQCLAQGDWASDARQRTTKYGDATFNLFRANFSKGGRILWERAVGYSSKLQSWTEVVRVWAILNQHDDQDAAIDRVYNAHRKGKLSHLKRKLRFVGKTSQCDQRESKAGVQLKLPRLLEPVADEMAGAILPLDLQDKLEKLDDDDAVIDDSAMSVLWYPPALPSEDSYTLIKFYEFTGPMLSSLMDRFVSETKELVDYPFRLSKHEDDICKLGLDNSKGSMESMLLLGRSGTGKTTCLVFRMWAQYRLWREFTGGDPSGLLRGATAASVGASHESSSSSYHQCFVTANPVLRSEVRKLVISLIRGAEDDATQLRLPPATPPSDRDMCGLATPSLSSASDAEFPLFVTKREILVLIDGTLRHPFFARSGPDGTLSREGARLAWGPVEKSAMQALLDDEDDDIDSDEDGEDEEESEEEMEEEMGDQEQVTASGSTKFRKSSRYAKEIDYDVFSRELWPSICKTVPGGESKYSPALIWSEIISFIKGSVEAVLKPFANDGDGDGDGDNDDVNVDVAQRTRVTALSLEQYESVGSKRAPNFTGNREDVYRMFEAYERKKAGIRGFDACDLVHHIWRGLLDQARAGEGAAGTGYTGAPLHAMYVDEVQDFTEAELALLVHISAMPNKMFFTGDTAQCIARGLSFRFQDLKSIFYHLSQRHHTSIVVPRDPYKLVHNMRTHSGILNCANICIELMQNLFPFSIDTQEPDTGLFDGPLPCLLEAASFDELVLLLYSGNKAEGHIEFGAGQVIIVRDEEAKRRLPAALRDSIVCTVFEAKGLEFTDVLLFNFFSDSPTKNNEWRCVLELLEEAGERGESSAAVPEEENSDVARLEGREARRLEFNPERHKLLLDELRALYTAITRARVNLWVYDENIKARAPMFKLWGVRGLVRRISKGLDPDGITLARGRESSKEEWLERGQSMMDKKLYKQAAFCFQHAGERRKQAAADALNLVMESSEAKSGSNSRDKVRQVQMRYEAAQLFLEAREGVTWAPEAAACLRYGGYPMLARQLYLALGNTKSAEKCLPRAPRSTKVPRKVPIAVKSNEGEEEEEKTKAKTTTASVMHVAEKEEARTPDEIDDDDAKIDEEEEEVYDEDDEDEDDVILSVLPSGDGRRRPRGGASRGRRGGGKGKKGPGKKKKK